MVAWDVEVTNRDGEPAASHDILMLVAMRCRRIALGATYQFR